MICLEQVRGDGNSQDGVGGGGGAKLVYHLVLGPLFWERPHRRAPMYALFWECPHPRSLTYPLFGECPQP